MCIDSFCRLSICSLTFFFFFKQKTAYEMRISDWSSDVCSSDLAIVVGDLNVAPLENDVWNHKRLRRSVGHTPLEAERMKDFWAAGELIDVPRHFVPEPEPLYTWWG